jgi:hypothetical protein
MIEPRSPDSMRMAALEFDARGIDWHYLQVEGRNWLEALPTGKLPAIVVKTSVRRRVRRFDPGVYVKEVQYRGLRALAKAFTTGNACREGAMLLQLGQLGVPVPEVLAFGSDSRFGIRIRDVLITKEVEASQSLHQFFLEIYPHLEFRARLQWIANFANFIRDLHNQGVIQRDLHLDNILVRQTAAGADFVLLDAQRVTIKARGLTVSERVANLAVLLCNFWSLAGTIQCFRFLKHYGLGWKNAAERRRLHHLIQLALAFSRHSWDAHARHALGTNAHFIKTHANGFTLYRTRQDETARPLEHLLPDPDRVLDQGEVLKDGHTVKPARVDLDGRPYILKRYNCEGWGDRWRNAFRSSRAKRTWLNTWGFRLRQLPVAEPLLCLEERRWRLPGRSYLLTQYLPAAQPLDRIWDDLDGALRQATIIHIAMVLGRIHRFGGALGDLKWNHLLLAIEDGKPRVTFSDLDESRMIPGASRYRRLNDVKRFLKDLEERDETRHYRRMFLRTWQRWAGLISSDGTPVGQIPGSP